MSLQWEYNISEMLGLGDWFIIHFTENNGMAFGFEFISKPFLSSFRIAALGLIGWYLVQLIKKNANPGFIASVSLIFAGAMGNILDSIFYGMIFSESTQYQVATLFPEGGGYASPLYGKVVDMFYFPILSGRFPDWLPFYGGEFWEFFRPVFNVADSAITVGIFTIILFQRKHFDL